MTAVPSQFGTRLLVNGGESQVNFYFSSIGQKLTLMQ